MTPTSASNPPLVRRATFAYALLALFGAAYVFFLITHTPQAVTSHGRWTIKETEALRLIGPSTGDLLKMDFRGAGVASVIAGQGSRIVEPKPGTLAMLVKYAPGFRARAPGSKLDVRIANDESSAAAVTIGLRPDGSAEPTVELRPDVQHGEAGIRLAASGATLTVTVDWSSSPPYRPGTGPLLIGDGEPTLSLGRAVISVPAGRGVFVGGPADKTDFEFGNRADRLSAGGLTVNALQIAGSEQEPVTSLACGAAQDGILRWPGVLGGFHAKSCRGVLNIQGLKLDDQSSFALSGPAFVVKDRIVRYWPLLPDLLSNLVIQMALTALVSTLIAWVAIHLNRRKASASSRPKRRNRRGSTERPHES